MGPHIIQPLKSQGVLAMEDSAMLVKAKFTARPGEQFVIRREAYQPDQAGVRRGGHPLRPSTGHGVRAAGNAGTGRVGCGRGGRRRQRPHPERSLMTLRLGRESALMMDVCWRRNAVGPSQA